MKVLSKKASQILGMLCLSSAFYGQTIGQEFVKNGDFGFAAGFPSISEWTQSPGGSWSGSLLQSSINSYSAYTKFSGQPGNYRVLSQTITLPSAGLYQLSYSEQFLKLSTPQFLVTIGSKSFQDVPTTMEVWEDFTHQVTLPAGDITLSLKGNAGGVTDVMTSLVKGGGDSLIYFGNVSLTYLGGGSSLANATNSAQFRNDVVFGTTFTTATINNYTSENASKTDFQPKGNPVNTPAHAAINAEFAEESLVAAKNIVPAKTVIKTSSDINVWGTALGQYMHQKKASGSNGFSSGSGGAIAGADWTLSNQSIGFAASYVYTYFGILNDQGHSNINQGTLSTYAVFRYCNWISNVSVLGGYAHDDNHRHFKNSTTKYHTHGSSHGWQLSPHLDIAYNGLVKNSWFNAVPYIMSDYVANWQSKYTESGSVGGKTSQGGKFYGFVRAESGFRFYETINVKYGKLILKEKGAYTYQRSTSTKSNSVSIIGATDAFVVPIGAHIQNMFVGEFSFEFVSGKKYVPDVEVSYEGQFGSKFIAQIGTINLSKKF